MLTLFTMTLVINFYQYKENEMLKTKLGYDFQRLVRGAIFELEDGNPEVWLATSISYTTNSISLVIKCL